METQNNATKQAAERGEPACTSREPSTAPEDATTTAVPAAPADFNSETTTPVEKQGLKKTEAGEGSSRENASAAVATNDAASAAPLSSPKTKPEPTSADVAAALSAAPAVMSDDDRKPGERVNRNRPTAAGVMTRRTKTVLEHWKGEPADEEDRDAEGEAKLVSHHSLKTASRASSRKGSRSAEASLPPPSSSLPRRSPSQPLSTAVTSSGPADLSFTVSAPPAPGTSVVPAPQAQHEVTENAKLATAAAPFMKPDEVWEATTRAAVVAQEHQLRQTLLSIFPASLRSIGMARLEEGEEEVVRAAVTTDTANTFHTPSTPLCNPEPLLPLLHALCEDKAYVHAAWCRYEDDQVVQRTYNSIQRKRHRHSFSRTTTRRSHASTTRVSAGHRDDGDEEGSGTDRDDDPDKDDDAPSDAEELEQQPQPPEWQWVEAPPALTGPPRSPARTTSSQVGPSALSPIHSDGARETACGFQWTPWRFYREKRRRCTSRRAPPLPAAAADAGGPVANAFSTTTSVAGLILGASPSAGAGSGTAGTATNASANANIVYNGGGSGVPALAYSEVPSLPVLQVDAEVPERINTPLEAMSAEERQSYARYVMSSGKLRNDCRDPYSFLVSRAKELRLQWERQHPFA